MIPDGDIKKDHHINLNNLTVSDVLEVSEEQFNQSQKFVTDSFQSVAYLNPDENPILLRDQVINSNLKLEKPKQKEHITSKSISLDGHSIK